MSRNHGRRIIDTVRNEDLREKTRSELYDIMADLILRAPDEARDMGLELISRKEVRRRDTHRQLLPILEQAREAQQ